MAVVGLRRLAPGAPDASAPSRPTVAVLAQPVQNVPQAPAELVGPPELTQPPAELVARVENASLPKPTVRTERARVTVPVMFAARPLELPEQGPPSVVDLSISPDANVGAINVTSNPPANLVLDGRPLGKAPRVVRVPAGVHTLLFIHPLYGRQSFSVNVGPGATTNASADF